MASIYENKWNVMPIVKQVAMLDKIGIGAHIADHLAWHRLSAPIQKQLKRAMAIIVKH